MGSYIADVSRALLAPLACLILTRLYCDCEVFIKDILRYHIVLWSVNLLNVRSPTYNDISDLLIP